MKLLLIISCLFLWQVQVSADQKDAFYTFTNQEGQQIRAEIMQVNNDQVTIRREDGARFQVPVSLFVEKDQTHIQNWQFRNTMGDSLRSPFDIELDTMQIRRSETQAHNYQHRDCQVKFTFTNHSSSEWSDLEIEYRVYYLDRSAYSRGASSGRVRMIEGKEKVKSLAPRQRHEFTSSSFTLTRMNLKPRWRYRGTSNRSSQDVYNGTWLRVYWNGELIREEVTDDSLKEDHDWPMRK
ncbi:MAG: hypothetical protein JJT75_06095 [Opitutales bacterium]|nr:hypothetical protein [Opitutales bacterium]MCH8540149.1 hypothetical protein [Opitutales bacterium]